MTTSTLALAAISALAIGLVLGLIGGGGSVLTVPVFVYLLGYPAKQAIAMTLPVVGTTSLVGAFRHWRAGNLQPKTALAFGAVAMAGSFVGARLAKLIDGRTQLIGLAVVMSIAAISMLRSGVKAAADPTKPPHEKPLVLIAISAGFVGLLTGLVGIGGGFLIVPALVLLGGVPMKPAVGTSLAVIAMNAFSGFAGYLGQVTFDWIPMAIFTAVAIVGILVGSWLAPRLSDARLKEGFAVFLLGVAAFILFQNRSALLGS
jgi:uncharacterized membrane protein YfcA